MGFTGENLDRRKFLKTGSMALATPLLLKVSGLFSLATAKAATAAIKVTDAYNKAIDKMVEGTRKMPVPMTVPVSRAAALSQPRPRSR